MRLRSLDFFEVSIRKAKSALLFFPNRQLLVKLAHTIRIFCTSKIHFHTIWHLLGAITSGSITFKISSKAGLGASPVTSAIF